MKLIVKAKHFKDARYTDNCNCGLSNAAKEQFNTNDVSEGVFDISINKIRYIHIHYRADNFDIDYDLAKLNNFNETVIRTIKLTEQ